MTTVRRFIIALTGASGAIYCQRLIELLCKQDNFEIYLMASGTGLKVASMELGTKLKDIKDAASYFAPEESTGKIIPVTENFFSSVASGSFQCEAMVVIPCTGGRLASFAAGVCRDIIDRAAEVTLKEKGRKLLLVHRETPLSSIHLENMLRLTRAGAVILPASPGFYHKPVEIMDLVDYVINRILDLVEVKLNISQRWK